MTAQTNAFAGAAALLAVVLIAEWLPQAQRPVPVPAPAPHTKSAASDQDTVSRDTAEWAATILRRPLFSIGRRPPKNTGTTHQVATGGLPRLSGIMITGSGRHAIFMPQGGKPITLAEGANLDEYTIRHISADRVFLAGPKGDLVLKPAYDASGRGATTAAGLPFPPNNFMQPSFPQPGNSLFAPSFAPPGQLPLGVPAQNQNDDNSEAPPQAPQQFPGLRGPFIPRGRG